MDRKKVVALGAAVTAFAAFAAWTALSIPDPPPVQETSQQQEMEYGKNVIREEVGGKLVWELVTSSSTVDMNTQTTVFKNAKGKYYFADGKELTLTAPEGNYNGETKNVKLWGGVTALMSDGTKLTSKELEWLAAAAERLRIADSAPKPILLGRHLIALGHKPSAKFGEWLHACFEAQLDGAFHDLPGALDYFRRRFGNAPAV